MKNKKTRKWGYELVFRADTGFKEEFMSRFIEGYLKALEENLKDFRNICKVDFKWFKWKENDEENDEKIKNDFILLRNTNLNL